MERHWIEQIKVAGEDLLDRVEGVVHEGNVRQIVIHHESHVVAEFPVTVGVIGVALAPMLAAVGALAAVLTHCTMVVERTEKLSELPTPTEIANQELARQELDEALIGEPLARR